MTTKQIVNLVLQGRLGGAIYEVLDRSNSALLLAGLSLALSVAAFLIALAALAR